MVGRRIFILVTLLLAFSLAIFAGTTGKIRGTVVDAETGEPLAGASVMLQGTSQGSYTDSDGNYFILQVSPGTYTVRCNIVGYATSVKRNVAVSADSTTTVDFDMEQKIAGKEEVVVEAQRPLVEKSDTQSGGSMTSEQLSQISGASIGKVEGLQAGAVQIGGQTHFRGGRGGETSYMLDGVPMNDAISGGRSINIEAGDIQEVQVLTGGFNAEYGEAQSGVVNIITKDARRNFAFSFGAETRVGDYKHFGPPIYKKETNVATGEEYVAIRSIDTDTGLNNYVDNIHYDKDYGDKIKPYYEFKGSMQGYIPGLPITFRLSGNYNKDGSYLPNDYQNNYYALAKINYKPTDNLNIKNTFVGDNDDGKIFWLANKWNQYDVKDETYRYTDNIKITHTLNPSTYYSVGFNYFTEDRKLGSELIFNDLEVSRSKSKYLDMWNYADRMLQPTDYYIDGMYPYVSIHQQKMYTFRGSITSQITQNHQLKAGGNVTSYDVERLNFQFYDKDTNYFSHYNENPIKGAFYIQDKAEYGNIIFNVGLRFQAFNANAKVPKDRYKVWGTSDVEYDKNADSHIRNPVDTTTKTAIAPRFAVSFPLTDMDVLHIQYGHFYQMPDFYSMYSGYKFDLEGDAPLIANPDLDYKKTVSYEFGFEHQFNDWLAMDMTIYSKDVSNLINTNKIIATGGDGQDVSYTYFYNHDYGNTKGFELKLEKRYSHHISGNLSYTFSIAKGNSSSNRQGYEYSFYGWDMPSKTTYLSWDKRHVLSGVVDIRWPDNFGINFSGNWSSGPPYTPPGGGQQSTDENSERFESSWTVDMKVDKTLHVGNYNLNLYVDVSNLFNKKNLNYDNITSGYVGQLMASDTGQPLTTYHNEDDPDGYYDSPFAYMPPREIIIGAQVSF